MKKIIKLIAFNILFIIIAIISFSQRCLGLSFNPNDSTFKFVLSLFLTIIGIPLFVFVNYTLLNQKEKIDYKIKNLSTINECIISLEKCKHTAPAFLVQIKEAINQLQTLQRRFDNLTTLLEQNGVSEKFSLINTTAEKANFFVFENIKRIITRLIVFDNEEYISNGQNYDIPEHTNYIRSLLEANDCILKEYQKMILAISVVEDMHKTNLAELQIMTESLNRVLGEQQFATLEKKYTETISLDK